MKEKSGRESAQAASKYLDRRRSPRNPKRLQAMKFSRVITAVMAVFLLAAAAFAADPQVASNVLRPPKGTKVAIVVFEDLQCPQCARTAPVLEQAAKTYHIPVLRHDFPLPKHNWSYDAAVLARYFDTQSPKLGNEFRDSVFQHQDEMTPQ